MSANDPAIRVRVARIGGYACLAKLGGKAMTVAATEGRRTRLNAQLIAQHGLDPKAPDFEQRLKGARSSYYGGLALRRKPK